LLKWCQNEIKSFWHCLESVCSGNLDNFCTQQIKSTWFNTRSKQNNFFSIFEIQDSRCFQTHPCLVSDERYQKIVRNHCIQGPPIIIAGILFQIRSWQAALATIGFVRIYIEKLRHLRCLAFVKVDKMFDSVCRAEAENSCLKLGLEVDQIDDLSTLMRIPQDLTSQKVLEKEVETGTEKEGTKFSREIFEDFCELKIDIWPKLVPGIEGFQRF